MKNEKPFTQAVIDSYIKQEILCPYCIDGSSTIGYGIEPNLDGHSLYQHIRCEDCGNEWNELYEMTSITKRIKA